MREDERYSESDLEDAIIRKIEHFMLELGKKVLFEGRQKRSLLMDRYWNGHYVNNKGYLATKYTAFTVPDIGIKKVAEKEAAEVAIGMQPRKS